MPRAIAITGIVVAALATAAPAQDLPPPDVLSAIIGQIPRKGGVPATIAFQPVNGAPDEACGLRRASMVLSSASETRSFPVMLDRNAASKPRDVLALLTRMTVDADGAPRSYHPDDPMGTGERCIVEARGEFKALTGVCALDAFSSAGVRVYRGAEPAKDDFAAAWNTIWPLIKARAVKPVRLKNLPEAADRVDGYYMFHSRAHALTALLKSPILPHHADGYPCLNRDGYFVSATTFETPRLRGSSNRCAAGRYLNSEVIPFFVIPGPSLGEITFGDLAIGRLATRDGERIVFGIVGDQGPPTKFGEGSIAFNQGLLGATRPLLNMKDLWTIDIGPAWLKDNDGTMSVLMLGGTRALMKGDFSRANIEAVGRQALARWNGRAGDPAARLRTCVGQANGGG